MRSPPRSGTPCSGSPIMTSPIENSYLNISAGLATPIQQDPALNVPPHSMPSPIQLEDWSFEPTQFPFTSPQPEYHFDKTPPYATPSPILVQTPLPTTTPISPSQENTSHIHIITCPCHTSLLAQTIQAISSTRPSSNYTYNHHLTPTKPLTIRDILPFKTLTTSLLSYTIPPHLATLLTSLPKSHEELSALPQYFLTTLLAHLSLPQIFSTAVLPCQAPTPSQIYAALKHRIYLYLLQHNLFFLVVLTKLHQFYTYYYSFWVIFNMINLPITLSLGILRIAKDIVGEVFWGFSTVMMGCETRSFGVASQRGTGKTSEEFGRGDDMVKSLSGELQDVEEFLVVDVD